MLNSRTINDSFLFSLSFFFFFVIVEQFLSHVTCMIQEISYRDIGSRYQNSRRILSRRREAHSLDTLATAKTHILRVKRKKSSRNNYTDILSRGIGTIRSHSANRFNQLLRRSVGWTCRTAFSTSAKKPSSMMNTHNGEEGRVHEATRVATRAGRRWFAPLFAKWVEIEEIQASGSSLNTRGTHVGNESNKSLFRLFFSFILGFFHLSSSGKISSNG